MGQVVEVCWETEKCQEVHPEKHMSQVPGFQQEGGKSPEEEKCQKHVTIAGSEGSLSPKKGTVVH